MCARFGFLNRTFANLISIYIFGHMRSHRVSFSFQFVFTFLALRSLRFCFWLGFALRWASFTNAVRSRKEIQASRGLWILFTPVWNEWIKVHIISKYSKRSSIKRKNLDVFHTLNVGMIVRLYVNYPKPRSCSEGRIYIRMCVCVCVCSTVCLSYVLVQIFLTVETVFIYSWDRRIFFFVRESTSLSYYFQNSTE